MRTYAVFWDAEKSHYPLKVVLTQWNIMCGCNAPLTPIPALRNTKHSCPYLGLYNITPLASLVHHYCKHYRISEVSGQGFLFMSVKVVINFMICLWCTVFNISHSMAPILTSAVCNESLKTHYFSLVTSHPVDILFPWFKQVKNIQNKRGLGTSLKDSYNIFLIKFFCWKVSKNWKYLCSKI